MGEQARAGIAFGDWLRWQGRRCDFPLTMPARVFLTHVDQYLILSRDNIQLFAALFADAIALTAAGTDFLCFGQIVLNANTRQVSGYGLRPRRFAVGVTGLGLGGMTLEACSATTCSAACVNSASLNISR